MSSNCAALKIPGEKDDQTIYERMKMLVQRAMDTGVPVLNSGSSSQPATPQPPQVIK